VARREAARQVEAARLAEVRAGIPTGAYATPLADVGLSTRVLNVLTEAGYNMAGQVLEKMGLDEDAILGLEGVGPKAIEEIRDTLGSFAYPVPVEVPAEAPVEEAAAEAAAAEAEAEPAAVEAAPAEVTEAAPAGELPVPVEAAEAAPLDAEAAKELVGKAFEVAAAQIVTAVEPEEEEEEAEKVEATPAGKKKKKKASRTVEFDPLTGEMVVKRRRKRGDAEWGEDL
jgi:hypothetical protein